MPETPLELIEQTHDPRTDTGALPPLPESAYAPGATPLSEPISWTTQRSDEQLASPVETIAALGYPITLVTGQQVRLRYSMLSLRALEHRFGSLVGIAAEINTAQAAMKRAQDDDTVGAQGPIFTILSDAIACGLVNVKLKHPDSGRVVRLGYELELLMERLDPSRLQEYLDAFAKALGQAFGTLGKEIATQMQEAASSRGEAGITSPSSSPDAQTNSSGT